MRNRLRVFALPLFAAAIAAICLTGQPAQAADSKSSASTVVKTKEGLHFNVPGDWPIEERNGSVGPVPVEEYLAMKFSGIESRLRTLEQQISGFDLRLRVLEEEVKSPRQRGLRSSEQVTQ